MTGHEVVPPPAERPLRAVLRRRPFTHHNRLTSAVVLANLVCAVVGDRPREEMFTAARLVFADIAANSPAAVTACKTVINTVDGLPDGPGLHAELEAFRHTFTTEDMREGTAAFLGKRSPALRT